jgi:polyhydroxyalkanoate synthesis regulator phasin
MNYRMKLAAAGATVAATIVLAVSGAAIAQATPGGGGLRELITAGTITRDQAQALKAETKAAREAARTEAIDELVAEGTITSDQGQAILAAGRDVRSLVTAGTITREQARAVKEELHSYQGTADSPHAKALASLVAKGTLTQAQADAISALHGARG